MNIKSNGYMCWRILTKEGKQERAGANNIINVIYTVFGYKRQQGPTGGLYFRQLNKKRAKIIFIL